MEQPKSENHLPPFDAKLVFVVVRVDERYVVYAVRNECYLVASHSVDIFQKRNGAFTHDDHLGRPRRYLFEYFLLQRFFFFDHRVARHH